jgi:nucleoside phosphorylase
MSDSRIVSVKPIIHYPRVAQVGKTYLMTIDLEVEAGAEWQYEEEEYPIYCTVDSELFSSKPVGEPVVVLHRFGGSYGEAKFLLTAAAAERQGNVKVALINAWGVLVKTIKLEQIQLLLREIPHTIADIEIDTTVVDPLPTDSEQLIVKSAEIQEEPETDEVAVGLALIITSHLVEYRAVCDHLIDLREEVHPQGTIYQRGQFLSDGWVWDVGIVEVGPGNVGAALEVERAIAYFKPDLILFVGVAGGVKDVALGDVVASTKVYGYELGKDEATFKPVPEMGLSGYSLEQRAKAEARKGRWLERLPIQPQSMPRIFIAPIAAGEKVLASTKSDVYKFLKSNYGDAIVVEMEGLGFLKAVRANRIDTIVVRGIAELIHKKGTSDDQDYQKIAARNASAFAFEILAKYYQYDVFISHSSKDKPWIVNTLLPQLQAEGFKVWIDHENISVGSSILENIEQAILTSRKTILVMSPNYLEGNWCKTEFEILLQNRDPANEKSRLIPLLIQKCQLPLAVRSLTYLNFVNPENEVTERQKLIDAVKTRRAKLVAPNFFAYDNCWVGQDGLIYDLSDRILTGETRLLVLLGITGIGKTALGERLAVESVEWFGNDWSRFHQENFDNEQQSSDFASVAERWLRLWGEIIIPEDRKDPQRLLNHLVRHLCQNRYIIQMDSLENILQGNEEEGWSEFQDAWWIKFFESYLKAGSCQSSIILTSQDLPGQIQLIETQSQKNCYFQALSGLMQSEQLALFEKTALDVSPNSVSRIYLERIGSAYEGHPLALRVIAGEINNQPFNGNVLAYWKRYGAEVEEVEKAIEEEKEGKMTGEDSWKLDRFTKTLRRNVRSRLNKTFARLQDEAKWAYVLLCESSIYHHPVPIDCWLGHLDDWDVSKDQQITALNILRDRCLVEECVGDNNEILLRQNNLVRSVSLEFLKHLDE